MRRPNDTERLWSHEGETLDLQSQRQPRFRSLDVHRIITEVLQQLAAPIDQQKIEASIDVPNGTCLLADDAMLRTALFNLTLNALQAMPEGGELLITAVSGPNGLELEVADSGPGLIDPSALIDTRQPSSGDLGTVQNFAACHGGRLTACNCPEGGAAFTLQLPARTMRAAA